MPVDYINIIDRVWGHSKLGSSNRTRSGGLTLRCVWTEALQRAREKTRMEEMYGHDRGKYKNQYTYRLK